ncbi:hypothetical protein [Segetibacter koreensis]|uniref:hypothetical protein n=1 Tax=Segetibacter koreensis TaxID=398037 RepID=UPI00035E9760|nr:hypothetical protein [Segetibacter koreensis]
MKKLSILSILLLTITQAFSCDICGCSSGNYFLGPFPQFRSHFFGTRYNFKSFESRLKSDHTQFSKDFYQSIELWGGLNIGRKWQVLSFVPYNINKQTSDDGTKTNNGIGDISFIVNHKILDKRNTNANEKMISQQLWVGGGLKLPTGKFSPDEVDIIPEANNQAGTGSVDFILNAMYTLHVEDWGINSNVNYKINRSAENFHFGNQFNTAAFVFHSFSSGSGNTTVNPNAGLLFEKIDANELNKSKVEDTGGNALLAAAGMEVNFAKMAVGFNTQLPVSQNLSNEQTKVKMRGMLHVTFLF